MEIYFLIGFGFACLSLTEYYMYEPKELRALDNTALVWLFAIMIILVWPILVIYDVIKYISYLRGK